MERLKTSELPSIETLAAIIETHDPATAKSLRTAETHQVRMPVANQSADQLTGWQSERRGKVTVVTVEWTRHSAYMGGTLHRGATVIQVSEGGRTGGEGWAETSQYLVKQPLTEDQATALAALLSTGVEPHLIARREL